jgi:hypothetical protein
MQCTIGWSNHQRQWGATAHRIAVVGLVALMAMGVSLESGGGWVACLRLWLFAAHFRPTRTGPPGCRRAARDMDWFHLPDQFYSERISSKVTPKG